MTNQAAWQSRTVPLASIDEAASAAVQARVAIDLAAVDDYAAAIESGATLPPVVLFRLPGGKHLIGDGWHRIAAHRKLGRDSIAAQVKDGDAHDALAFACSANSAHGLRRTAADKRRAVELLLCDQGYGGLSDRLIADLAKVSGHFVGKVRAGLDGDQSPPPTARARSSTDAARKGRDGRSRRAPKRKPRRSASAVAPKATRALDAVDAENLRPPADAVPATNVAGESLAAVVAAFVWSPGWSAARLKKARAIINKIADELTQLVLVAPDGEATEPRRQSVHAARVALETIADAMVKGGRI